MSPDGLFRLQVSYSQVSKPCGYQNKLDRITWAHERGEHVESNPLCRLCLGLPPAPKGIKPIAGTAVHAAIEFALMTEGDEALAIEHGRRVLRDELYEAWAPGEGGVLWDDPPQIRRDGQPWANQRDRMPSLVEAEVNFEQAVRAWLARFGGRVELDGQPEREVRIALQGEYEGCFLKCVLDLPTTEGGLVDLKLSGSSTWDRDDKLDGKLVQGHLYNLAYAQLFGHPPTSMVFHVLKTGTSEIQVIKVDYDEAAIAETLEHIVYPRIRAIERDALLPNLDGFQHSPKYCDHWWVCPLGGAARGRGVRVELELVA